jgi:hypothetical protein
LKPNNMKTRKIVSITDLFTDDFIQKHSQYKSLEKIVKASGIGGIENVLDIIPNLLYLSN